MSTLFTCFPAFIGHMDNCREASGTIYKQSTQKLSQPFFFFFLLSHLLVAGCDIGVRFSARLSVCQHLCRHSTFMSELVI